MLLRSHTLCYYVHKYMMIHTYIQEKKTLVSDYLQTYLKHTVLPRVSPAGRWGNDAVTRILNFTTQGKMLRSALIYLGEILFSQKKHSDVLLKTSAALELIQTGLLIHDDIMDQDEKRRGTDSVHIQYRKIFQSSGSNDAEKAGESFAICAGDMSFFLAFQILAEIRPLCLSEKLNALFSKELTNVCAAQMQDLYGGNFQKQLSKEEIFSMYMYKTGRYSCGLPLVGGALIAGASDQTIKHLWKLGTGLGMLFQIKDDELNLFGKPKITGKPTGSDIREGKQTLFRLFVMEKARGEVKKRLESLFGNPVLSPGEVNYVKKQITDLHVYDDIHGIVKEQEQIIDEMLKHLPLHDDKRTFIREFVDYLNTRDK
jgi:geranylgeranyl diphosphate synthase type I